MAAPRCSNPSADRAMPAVAFPGPSPGIACAAIDGAAVRLGNDVVELEWRCEHGRLAPVRLVDGVSGCAVDLTAAACFAVVLGDTPAAALRSLSCAEFSVATGPAVEEAGGGGESLRAAAALGGKQIRARFISADGQLAVDWCAVLLDGTHYIRQVLTLHALCEPLELEEVVLFDLAAPGATITSEVDGSPVVAGAFFFGCEHPLSRSSVAKVEGVARLRCSMPGTAALAPGAPLTCSSVVAVAPAGQLRRSFLCYLEHERAQPYRQLLHYNNGYEIGCEYWAWKRSDDPSKAEAFRGRMEQVWLDTMRVFGSELVEKREVRLDAFAHDFMWDDEDVVWRFHAGYPNGFSPARRVAEQYGAEVGVWFSPAGGYPGRSARVASGREQGFETNDKGLTLGGPRYWARFREACANMIRRYGVCYFKFDGFGGGNNQPGAGPYRSDVVGLLRVIEELRALRSDVFINPSTGSWPSPFWLLWADCIWRSGSDSGLCGKGSDRQQWMTYRDSETYARVVKRAPLYPLSSLMLHGLFIHSKPFVDNPYDHDSPGQTYELADIVSEIRSFFGGGTNLQELYINPDVMPAAGWDALAEAAAWARDNADVLADTHWIGGDPAQTEAYGWASWAPRKGILTLRNPDDRPASIELDIGQAFELPGGAPTRYVLRSPWRQEADAAEVTIEAGRPHRFELDPFEVLVREALPVTD